MRPMRKPMRFRYCVECQSTVRVARDACDHGSNTPTHFLVRYPESSNISASATFPDRMRRRLSYIMKGNGAEVSVKRHCFVLIGDVYNNGSCNYSQPSSGLCIRQSSLDDNSCQRSSASALNRLNARRQLNQGYHNNNQDEAGGGVLFNMHLQACDANPDLAKIFSSSVCSLSEFNKSYRLLDDNVH